MFAQLQVGVLWRTELTGSFEHCDDSASRLPGYPLCSCVRASVHYLLALVSFQCRAGLYFDLEHCFFSQLL